MSDLIFLFAVHNHQPVGNFDHVVRKAFADGYLPFLKAVAAHPEFRFTLHFSGPLWEAMERTEGECWDLVSLMVGRGQVELLGGGFYEPVLAVIPEEDRIGQLRMMSDFLKERFGRRPRGLWLAERVWEPHLPRSLAEAGLEYTLLDEEHFRYAGVERMAASYVTEDEGRALRVFPIDKTLRYLIPFRSLDEIGRYFDKIRSAGGPAILGDDGEKFGVWPGTSRWVYEEGWLEKFLRWAESTGLRTMTFSEYLDAFPPEGRVYLPPASYEEMMEWVLEPEAQDRFKRLKAGADPSDRRYLRGGLFRDFFRKYPEADHLHKRMIAVSREVSAAGGDPEARQAIYRAQCNDPYWHGVFGGLYLPHLREAAYRNILEAEKRLPLSTEWEPLDFLAGDRTALRFRGPVFHGLIAPGLGGAALEIDHRPSLRNLSNVLSRRAEAYHKGPQSNEGTSQEGGRSIHELGKALPAGSEELVRPDRYRRLSLLDHFFDPATTSEDMRRGEHREQGDFIGRPFQAEVKGARLTLTRRADVRSSDRPRPLSVSKTIEASGPSFKVAVEIENLAADEASLTYGLEWNLLAFPGEVVIAEDTFTLYGGQIRLIAAGASEMWAFPLRTLSQSEEGFDIIHQGVCLCPVWRLVLGGNEKARLDIVLEENDGR